MNERLHERRAGNKSPVLLERFRGKEERHRGCGNDEVGGCGPDNVEIQRGIELNSAGRLECHRRGGRYAEEAQHRVGIVVEYAVESACAQYNSQDKSELVEFGVYLEQDESPYLDEEGAGKVGEYILNGKERLDCIHGGKKGGYSRRECNATYTDEGGPDFDNDKECVFRDVVSEFRCDYFAGENSGKED